MGYEDRQRELEALSASPYQSHYALGQFDQLVNNRPMSAGTPGIAYTPPMSEHSYPGSPAPPCDVHFLPLNPAQPLFYDSTDSGSEPHTPDTSGLTTATADAFSDMAIDPSAFFTGGQTSDMTL
jgi:hypothetical protein